MFSLRMDVEKIRPAGGHVLVRLKKPEESTPSGIIIPDSARKLDTMEATVVAVGPGTWAERGHRRIEPEVKKGDRVLVGRHAGVNPTPKFRPDPDMLIVIEDELLAVLED